MGLGLNAAGLRVQGVSGLVGSADCFVNRDTLNPKPTCLRGRWEKVFVVLCRFHLSSGVGLFPGLV